MSAALIPLVKRFDDGVPRVRDLDLAAALAYTNPIDIRQLIRRRRAYLEEFGLIVTVQINTDGRGRPGEEYWLTERQAVALCRFAETEKADEVCIALVETFIQYRHGALVPREETVETRCLAIQANSAVAAIQMQLVQLTDRVERVEGKQDELLTVVKSEVLPLVKDIAECVKHQRVRIRARVCARHLDYLERFYVGLCPCCRVVRLIENHSPTEECTFDHWCGRHKAGLDETWPVCRKCNSRLEHEPHFKEQRRGAFGEYQYGLMRYAAPLFADLS